MTVARSSKSHDVKRHPDTLPARDRPRPAPGPRGPAPPDAAHCRRRPAGPEPSHTRGRPVVDRSPCRVTARSEAMPSQSHPAGHFLLSLGSTHVRLEKAAGGLPSGARSPSSGPARETPPRSSASRRVRYEPFRLAVGMGMGQPPLRLDQGGARRRARGARTGPSRSRAPAAEGRARTATSATRSSEEVEVPRRSTGAARSRLTSRSALAPEADHPRRRRRSEAHGHCHTLKQKQWLALATSASASRASRNACKRVATIDAFTDQADPRRGRRWRVRDPDQAPDDARDPEPEGHVLRRRRDALAGLVRRLRGRRGNARPGQREGRRHRVPRPERSQG